MSEPSVSSVSLRLFGALCALVAGAAALGVVALLGHRTPGPVASAATSRPAAPARTTTTPARRSGFPAPPDGAVVFSREDGDEVLALAVVPGRRQLGLQASVVGPQGNGVGGLPVSFVVAGRSVQAEPCGAGCYRATAPIASAPSRIDVVVGRRGRPTTWRVPMPRPWPPPDGSAVVARATQNFKDLRTLVIHDRLASDAEHAAVTRWVIVGPDRLSYQVENGPAGIIVGNRRWDKVPGGTWQEAAQTPIHQPAPFWLSWKDARVLSQTKDAWRISFYDPKTPAWYELLIAKRSMLPLEMHMNTTSHFMHDVYGSFNAPLRVNPPRS
jgi:hypothetical protein